MIKAKHNKGLYGFAKAAKLFPMIRYLYVFCALLMLGGCGFQPVYGTLGQNSAPVEQYFSLIEINNIPDREGQYLRNALIDRFHRNGAPSNPQFILSVDPIIERLIDLDITKDSDTTRGQLRVQTSFILRDAYDKKVLLNRKIGSIASYNILASEFSTRVSEDNTRLNALNDLANQIEQQIALYFKRR